ncbi:glutathione S-transferase N-terminal domain-containing protein [Sorangium sp. So ce327]|uniref:glutathione S-transferase family protein n=1 Tax=Sorangium sp. So ce327 TaxID=3133301 RepID=UPI003F5E2586
MSAPASPARLRLHHAASSYYSMIARLALVERGVPFESVRVDIHRRAQQLAPDYARLNPNLTVPTLEVDGRVLSQSRDILLFAFGTTEAALDDATRGWLDRHYAFPIEELTFGWLLSWNPLARPAVRRTLVATEKRLRQLATEHADLADVYARRAEVFAGRVKTFDPGGVVAMFGERKRAAFELLDALDDALADGRESLVPGGHGPADVVWTVFLARMGFVRFDAEIARRARLARYAKAVKTRPSFREADVWDRLSPLKLIKQVL